jgi:chemotaxis protein CheD
MQGETYVTSEPGEVVVTVLGSCVAACIRDPERGIGGMNHFLLPEGMGGARDARCYGINAMEILINDILKRGGNRHRLQAKLFGGANVMAGLSGIGTRNADFAERFLHDEGIAMIGSSVGGSLARKVQFWPASGRARQAFVRDDAGAISASEIRATRHEPPSGDVELF